MSDDTKTPREQYVDAHGEKATQKVDQALMSILVKQVGQELHGALVSHGMSTAAAYAIICVDVDSRAIAYGSNIQRGSLAELLEDLRNKLLVADATADGAAAKKD